MKTDLITYNVKDRGRKARGVDRNFDTAALAKLINGASVQEKVRHGDMFGYYGHWPRQVLGMEPSEGGIIDGKVISIPPALRTIELRADNDGTIYHRAEFLDTNEGKTAARLYASKAGGFSSAIDAVPNTSPAVAKRFCGFDFVLEPNYTTNRGHKVMLDSVLSERDRMMVMLDSAVGESMDAAAAMGAIFDALQAQHERALKALERVEAENNDLLGRMARGRTDAVLDGVTMRPIRASKPDDYEAYRSMPLARLSELPVEAPAPSDDIKSLQRQYGFKV